MREIQGWVRAAAVVWLGVVLAASPAAAQEVAGLTFDVTVTPVDSGMGVAQSGRGWIAGKQSRIDLRGPANPAHTMPGMPGQNMSVIVRDSADGPAITMLDHDTRKFMNPGKMMEQMRSMMASLPEPPRMTFTVSNVSVDSLGSGETISGFATKRFRLKADITVAIQMLDESAEQTMRMETEGDYAEELSDFIDPLQSSRTFQSFASGMPFIDSTGAAELAKLAAITPRGLPLRHIDRMTGISEGGEPVQGSVTALSNIRRETFPLAVFSIPEGYTELELPMMPAMN